MAASEANKGVKKLQKSYFDVLGLCCSSEVALIEKILKPLEGVEDVSVIVPSKTVIVIHDNLLISQLQIVKALNQARLEANVRANGGGNYQKKWPSPFAVVCGILLLLSFLKYFYHPFQWLALGAVAVGIFPIVMRAFAAIRNFTLDINLLMLIAVAGSIGLKDYWEAGTIVFLFTTAEWLESRASHKATAVMSSLVNMVPQRALLAETGEEVDAGEVKVNTVLAVKAGEIIPIDGIVVEGNCEVDEKTLTGESFPVAKQIESTVWAGTINLNGYISVKTTAIAEDCVVSRMAKLVEEAQNNKSKTQRLIDKCAKYYTPAVVAISTCLAVIPAALRIHNRNEWYHLALVVLVSACPCALILSTPIATFCALSKAATSGLLIKGAEYLETLAKIRIMAFDKTGTITRGEFMVADFQSLLDDVSLNTLLYWVSSIENKSSHPMAAALIEYAQSHSVEPKPDNVEEFQNFPGEGIYGKIDGKDICVGNRKIAMRAGCATVPTSEATDAKEGKSIGYVFTGSSPAGIFSLSDVCRTGVTEAIKELKSMGIKTAMLTGDSNAAAKHAQDQLGGALEMVHAELLPEDKARIIKEFQKEAPTAMIGDGLNDAAALATADIGISMGISGSALATETGQIILMSNDIRKIPKAAQLARRTRRKVIENVILAISTKTAIIALAIAGHPLVWAAVLADVGTCLLVIFNSMLLLQGTPPRKGRKCCKSSAAPRVNKHGCKTDCSPSSQTRKDCCSGTEAQKKCTSPKLSSKKCCKSSAAPNVNKHGCKADGSPSSQTRKNCCGGTEAQKKCVPQDCSSKVCAPRCPSSPSSSMLCGNDKCSDSTDKRDGCVKADQLQDANAHPDCCSGTEVLKKGNHQKCPSRNCAPRCQAEPLSSMSCGNNKCSDSADKHGGCVLSDQLQEAKHPDHGSCDMVTQGMGSQAVQNRGCMDHSISSSCAEDKCVNSIERHCGSVHNQFDHKEKHCEHNTCSPIDHDIGSNSTVHSDHSVSSSEPGRHTDNNNHCMNHCSNDNLKDEITEAALDNMVKTCCKNNGGSLLDSAGNILSGDNHVECTAIKACRSLEKRHISGCCLSFRKKCCGNSPHFGVGFKGGLSEIIIE